MALPVTIPNTFANATSSIPLANLDANFVTIYGAVNGIGNGSEALDNVSISGGAISNTSVSTTTLNTSGQVVFNDAGADVDFRVEGDTDANLLFVDASTDRVGIGTSSPGAKLATSTARAATVVSALFGTTGTGVVEDVNKLSLSVQNTLSGATGGVAIGAVLQASASNATALAFYNDSGFGAQTEHMRLNSSGNLGLGVTPSAWGTASNAKAIQLPGAALLGFNDLNLYLISNSFFNGSNFIYTSTGSASQYEQVNGKHQWHVAPSGTAGNTISFTQAMTLDASGNLGIGTTTINAGSRLQIAGGGSGAVGALRFSDGGGTNFWDIGRDNGVAGFFTITGQGTERMNISTSGIVTMNVYGAGAATFSASGVISSVSDETWKTKDGVPVDPDAMIQMLEPGYWYYNEEKAPTFGADRQLGFYAQNVNAAIGPEAAPTPEEGKPWGYYDRSVLAVAVMSLKNALNSIQELSAKNDALEARIAALEGQ